MADEREQGHGNKWNQDKASRQSYRESRTNAVMTTTSARGPSIKRQQENLNKPSVLQPNSLSPLSFFRCAAPPSLPSHPLLTSSTMTQTSSIPVRNSFAPIAPASATTSPMTASAPVTPTPAHYAGKTHVDQPRSERALHWQRQVEEVREEERREAERLLLHAERELVKGKGVARAKPAVSNAPSKPLAVPTPTTEAKEHT